MSTRVYRIQDRPTFNLTHNQELGFYLDMIDENERTNSVRISSIENVIEAAVQGKITLTLDEAYNLYGDIQHAKAHHADHVYYACI